MDLLQSVFTMGKSAKRRPINTQGNVFYVAGSGSDSYDGLTPDRAVKTLEHVQTNLITANQNDIVVILAETNAATPGTIRVAEGGLTWSTDGVHFVGVCSGSIIGQRARISHASSGDATSTFVMTLSANNCAFENIQFFLGHGGTVTAPNAVKVTGARNYFKNCMISGGANAAMDVAGAGSLWLSAASENTFEHCYIGVETVSKGGNANAEINISGGSARNFFLDCIIETWAEATTHQFVLVPASGLQGLTLFKGCTFLNAGNVLGPGTAVTDAISLNATQNGHIHIANCQAFATTTWADSTTLVTVAGGAAPHATGGIAVAST